MFNIIGKYSTATIYTDKVEQEALSQILEVCNQEFTKGCKVAIMPDCHSGKGCTIGTTIEVKDKVVPNLVGVDIGCGVYCVMIKEKKIDFDKLDYIIRQHIPSGQNIRTSSHKYSNLIDLNLLACKHKVNIDRAIKSIGTLGGGNHFIEVAKDNNDNLYLVIHSGSRYLGKQIAEHYQRKAINYHKNLKISKNNIIKQLKSEGREKDIQKVLNEFNPVKINESLAYLEDNDLKDYLHDMNIAQLYAELNRKAMANVILDKMNLTEVESFTTIHNYIDIDCMILRKGAISAKLNEKVLIPINMRDGSLICIGKGNPDWNYSAPHGAGRIMSRSKAKEIVNLDDFINAMKDVWTTSVGQSTIDESPMAYKSIQDITDNIGGTVDVLTIINPVYNFKSS